LRNAFFVYPSSCVCRLCDKH